MASLFLALSKSIDRRVTSEGGELRQFNELPHDILQKLEQHQASADRLLDMGAAEIGALIRNQKFGPVVQRLVRRLPRLSVRHEAQPITRGILRLSLVLTAAFQWDVKYHGQVESFWVWVRDGESDHIYHSEPLLLHRKQSTTEHCLEFTLPIREPLASQYFVHVVSDRWVGCETIVPVSFKHLILPDVHPPHTDLLDMHPVPVTALQNPLFEALYVRRGIRFFNPIQSQTFHLLYHSSKNVLVGAPTGSGKTITAELAILQLLAANPAAKTVYVAPLKALARERLADWKKKLGEALGLVVVELTGDVTPDVALLKRAHVIITTPEKVRRPHSLTPYSLHTHSTPTPLPLHTHSLPVPVTLPAWCVLKITSSPSSSTTFILSCMLFACAVCLSHAMIMAVGRHHSRLAAGGAAVCEAGGSGDHRRDSFAGRGQRARAGGDRESHALHLGPDPVACALRGAVHSTG